MSGYFEAKTSAPTLIWVIRNGARNVRASAVTEGFVKPTVRSPVETNKNESSGGPEGSSRGVADRGCRNINRRSPGVRSADLPCLKCVPPRGSGIPQGVGHPRGWTMPTVAFASANCPGFLVETAQVTQIPRRRRALPLIITQLFDKKNQPLYYSACPQI